MLKYNVLLYIIVLWLFSLSCAINEKHQIWYTKISDTINVNTDIVDSLPLQAYIQNIRLITLETKPSALINSISKLSSGKKYLYLLDKRQNSIFIFFQSGQFYKKISKSGKAGDEYFRIDDFEIDKQEKVVYILDMITRRILKYDFNGKLINTYRLDFYANNFFKIKDGFVFSIDNECNKDFCDKIIFCDQKFQKLRTFLPVQPNFKHFSIETPTSRLVKISDTKLKYIDINDVIYSFNGEQINYERINFGKKTMEASFYDKKFGDAGNFLDQVIRQKKAIWIHNYLESNDLIFFKYFESGQTFSYLQSKKSRKGLVLRKEESIFITHDPILVDGNSCFEIKSCAEILSKKRQSSSTIDSILFKQLETKSSTLNEGSNPVIVKYSTVL